MGSANTTNNRRRSRTNGRRRQSNGEQNNYNRNHNANVDNDFHNNFPQIHMPIIRINEMVLNPINRNNPNNIRIRRIIPINDLDFTNYNIREGNQNNNRRHIRASRFNDGNNVGNLGELFMNLNAMIHDLNSNLLPRLMNIQESHRFENPTTASIVSQLPEVEIDSPEKLDEEKRKCIICLSEFTQGEKAIILPCIHFFHEECIKNWLEKQNFCPICKFELTKENLEKIG